MCSDVEQYAPPYYECYSTAEALIERLQRERRFGVQSQQLAVLAAMNGRTELAVEALREYAGMEPGETLPASSPLGTFVRAFVDYFEIGGDLVS